MEQPIKTYIKNKIDWIKKELNVTTLSNDEIISDALTNKIINIKATQKRIKKLKSKNEVK